MTGGLMGGYPLGHFIDIPRRRTQMAEQYTPTTEDVREAYAGYAWLGPGRSDVTPEFERWLAAHDAQVGANALYDAADDWAANPDSWGDNEKDYRNELRDRADRIAGGTSHE